MQLIKQRLSLFQIKRVEALSKPVVDRGEQNHGPHPACPDHARAAPCSWLRAAPGTLLAVDVLPQVHDPNTLLSFLDARSARAPGAKQRPHQQGALIWPITHLLDQCRDGWRVRPNPTGSIVVAHHHGRRIVRRNSHWLTLVPEQGAAQGHASEKNATTVKNIPPLFRREGFSPRSCLSKSSQSRWSIEGLLYRKCPHENAHKRPAFRFCRVVATFEKWIRRS